MRSHQTWNVCCFWFVLLSSFVNNFSCVCAKNLRLLWFHTGETNTSGSPTDIIKVTQFKFQHFYFVLHGCSLVLYVTLHSNIAFENLVLNSSHAQRSKTGSYLLIRSSSWKQSSQYIFDSMTKARFENWWPMWKLVQWVYNPNSRSSSSFNSWASFCIFSSCKKGGNYYNIYIIINNF